MHNDLSFQYFLLGIFAVANNFKALGKFLQITEGLSKEERLKISLRATLASLSIMLLALFCGEAVLKFVGVSLDSFRIAGGLVLVILGLDMIHARDSVNEEIQAQPPNVYSSVISSAIIPIAIPMTTGAGTFSTIIIFVNALGKPWGPIYFQLLAAILVQALMIYLVFRYSRDLLRLLGPTGMSVLIRIVGLFTLSQGIQFIIIGISKAFPALV
jgi:multiple antibiotic resistance protein